MHFSQGLTIFAKHKTKDDTTMKITKTEVNLEYLIQAALSLLYKNDKHLIDIHANERSLVFRFGYYFQNLLSMHSEYKEYDLDLEYNRDGEVPKRTPNHEKGIYPDVILHKRGDNEDNLLVMEFKGYWNNQGQEEDKSKIHDLMYSNGEYKYKKGYTILLKEDDFLVRPVYNSDISLL